MQKYYLRYDGQSSMLLLVASTEDVAGINIRDRLLEAAEWIEDCEFAGYPVRKRGDVLLATMDKMHLKADEIDLEFKDSTGYEADEVIFLSRHRAASGTPTLTVHPIGNYGKAEHGGRDGTLAPCSPGRMAALLRALKKEAEGIPFNVSFETTHHGPLLSKPTCFIEIGSDETKWGNVDAAKALAQAILGHELREGRLAIGIGGGHYAPRFTEVCLARRVAFGHMIPNYAIEKMDETGFVEMAKAALLNSRADCAYIHRKSMPGSKATLLKKLLESAGIEVLDSDKVPLL
jgi:D-aminoacyl-tRNA deacylase